MKRQKSKSRSPPKQPHPETPIRKAPVKLKTESKPIKIAKPAPKQSLEHTTDRLYKMAPSLKAKKESFIKEQQIKQVQRFKRPQTARTKEEK